MTTYVINTQHETRDTGDITIEKRLDEISNKLSRVLTKDDSFFIKEIIKETVEQLKEKQIKAIGKWFDDKIKDTYIKINGEYKDCVFTNNWLKK